MITIWGGATARTLRPHWMLHELGVDYEPKLIGSRTGETQDDAFVKLNVKEKIPVLVDGDLVLTESAAIVTYLGDTYGADSGLVPGYLAAVGKGLPEANLRARRHDLLHMVALREAELLECRLERGRAGAPKAGADHLQCHHLPTG